jgi:CxxC-x17-CxxC domain-containing protein
MNDFKKRNKFGGGERRGGSFGGKPSFRGGSDKGFGRVELFQATCASCSKTCEVPFRPNGKKPVYCKECFSQQNEGAPARENSYGDRPARREFTPAYKPEYKQEYKPEYKPEHKPVADNSMFEIKKQLEAVNAKLDKLIQIMTPKATVAPVKEIKEIKEVKTKKIAPKKKK